MEQFAQVDIGQGASNPAYFLHPIYWQKDVQPGDSKIRMSEVNQGLVTEWSQNIWYCSNFYFILFFF